MVLTICIMIFVLELMKLNIRSLELLYVSSDFPLFVFSFASTAWIAILAGSGLCSPKLLADLSSLSESSCGCLPVAALVQKIQPVSFYITIIKETTSEEDSWRALWLVQVRLTTVSNHSKAINKVYSFGLQGLFITLSWLIH